MRINNQKTTLTIVDGVCTITPLANRRTIAVLENVNEQVIFHVSITNAIIGDELTLVLKRAEGGDWGFKFLAEDNFQFSSCRSLETDFFQPGGDSWIGNFFFDGTYFVNTYEDC
jgi:hypothetical protein